MSDSSGSFRNTRVIPFCFEKTKITKPESLKSDRVICRGMVRGVLKISNETSQQSTEAQLQPCGQNKTYAAASGNGDANDGRVRR